MAVSYKKLFHLLVDRDMTAVQLQQQAGYSANITTRLKKNAYISLESVEKICRALDCTLDDIVEFILHTQEVTGSSPAVSTRKTPRFH